MTDYRGVDWHIWLGGDCPFRDDGFESIVSLMVSSFRKD